MKTLLCALALLSGLGAWAANPSFNDVALIPIVPLGAAGNGVTDDTAALQAAINIAAGSSVTNGLIIIPAGTYHLTSQLTVPPGQYVTNGPVGIRSGLTIRGAGPGKTILDFSAIGNGIGLCLTNYAYDYVSIENLQLKGPMTPTTTSVGIALGASGTTGYTNYPISHTSGWSGSINSVQSVAIIGFGTGLAITNQWNVFVRGCNISSNAYYGIASVNSHGPNIDNCQFIGPWGVPGGTAIGFVGSGAALGDNGTIKNCTILNWTNAVENEELLLNMVDVHMENCNTYYLSTTSATAYPGCNMDGGYILDNGTVLSTWFGAAEEIACCKIDRLNAMRLRINNTLIDTTSSGRAVANVISDGTYSAAFPDVYSPFLGVTYNVRLDTTNSLTFRQRPEVQWASYEGFFQNWNYGFQAPNNNISGWVGCIFTVGTNDLWLTDLGRQAQYPFTNTTHRVMLLNYADLSTNGFVDLPYTQNYATWIYSPCEILLPAGSTNLMITDAGSGLDYWSFVTPSVLDTNIVKIWSSTAATSAGPFALGSTNREYGPLNFKYRLGKGTHSGMMAASALPFVSQLGFTSYTTNLWTSISANGFTNDTAHSWGTNTMVVDIISVGETVQFYTRTGAGGQTSCGTLLFTDTGIANKEYVVGVNCGIKFSVGTFTSGTARGF